MTTESLINVMIRGAGHTWTSEELEACSRPPYPLPADVESARLRAVAELADVPSPVGNPTWVVTRLLATRQELGAALAALRRSGGFRVADAVCVLVAGGALTLADVDRFVESVGVPSWSGLPRQVVHVHLAAGRLAEADAAAAAMGEHAWLGNRDIALVLAERGDTREVLARWRDLRPGTDRRGADAIRSALVREIARREGWRAALEVSSDARIGTRFRGSAFTALVDDGKVDALLDLFANEAADVLDELSQLAMLTRAIRADASRPPGTDHPALAGVLARIEAIDPSADKQTMRVRDSLLFECWYGTGEEGTLRRIRSAIRTPMLRRELTSLHRALA